MNTQAVDVQARYSAAPEITQIPRAPLSPSTNTADALVGAMVPFTDDELAESTKPYPHLFMAGRRGLFPRGEVTLIAAPGREGKTYTVVGLLTSYALGIEVGGMRPQGNGRVAILSAEDARRQYAAKVAAAAAGLGAADRERVKARIIVPDLFKKGLDSLQVLVKMLDRQPAESAAVDAIIDAVHRMGLDALIFETASTLSEAEEDNLGFGALIKALKRIARETELPVVLTHHTSQAAAGNLARLDISVADIRGATALVYNSRQNCLLLNLGREGNGFPASDARTILRKMVLPRATERITALVPLDSSMAADPPVVFFKWTITPDGVPAPEVALPERQYQGLTWLQLKECLAGAKASAREARDGAKTEAEAKAVAEAAQTLAAQGTPASAKAIAGCVGRSTGWVAKRLADAVARGLLTTSEARIPRTVGMTTVYKPAD